MSWIYNQPPPPSQASHGFSQGGQQQPYGHGGSGGGGGYSNPSHHPHQPHSSSSASASQPHQGGPVSSSSSHRGGHHYPAAARADYGPAAAAAAATPADYYQSAHLHSAAAAAQPSAHSPAGGPYGQSWPTPDHYHQSLPPHGHGPPASAPPYGSYPAYSSPQYAAGQQGFGHPPPSYPSYQPSASTAPSPWHTSVSIHSQPSSYTHSQPPGPGPRPRGGFHGDRGSRASVAPPVHNGYEGSVPPPPSSNGYASAYPPNRATPYSSPPYPFPPPPIHVTLPPRRSDSQFGNNNSRRGRGGGGHRDGSGGRGGGKPHHNNDRQRFHHNNHQHKNAPSAQPAASGTPISDASLANKKKKRKMDPFGLKGTVGDDASGDEDDDEARLPKILGNDGIPLPSDLGEWLANRRKNFPTKARIAQKKAEEAERKAAEEAEQAKKMEKEAEALALEKQASVLRKQLKKVESSIKRKRDLHDDGDELRASSSEPDSDDGPPETLSTRAPPSSSQEDPSKKADPTQPCKYYSTGASCGKGSKCRFVHDHAERERALREKAANNDSHTIRQRLVLNDQRQEDFDILQCIVYLRDKHVEGAESRIKTLLKQAKQEQSLSKPKPNPLSTLPAKPPTLPDNPIKKDGSKRPFNRKDSGSAHNQATKPEPQPDPGTAHYHGWNGGAPSDDLP